MLTITITPRAVLLAALLAFGALTAFYATSALGSSDPPDSIIQGDTDCDGDVDVQDALHNLRYAGGLPVGPFGACPEIGTTAAIPGPQGPPGPSGTSLWAHVRANGNIELGTAVSAEYADNDTYVVTFDQDLTACAAFVTKGWTDGGSYSPAGRLRGANVAEPGPNDVEISFTIEGTNNRTTTDFHLLVVC